MSLYKQKLKYYVYMEVFMNLGKNLQILRKMANMTQEELAVKMSVSRQTVSKWELGTVLPEIETLIELCELFNCSVDQLLRDTMDFGNEAYSDIKTVTVEPFRYISYAVIGCEPEEDAITHVEGWAKHLKIENPHIIGWDFPHVSQEQRNVYHMRGYEAALILDAEQAVWDLDVEIIRQNTQKNAYKALLTYMAINGIKEKHDPSVIPCYEYEYFDDKGDKFMDIYIAIQ